MLKQNYEYWCRCIEIFNQTKLSIRNFLFAIEVSTMHLIAQFFIWLFQVRRIYGRSRLNLFVLYDNIRADTTTNISYETEYE
jgi:hypothetical protein